MKTGDMSKVVILKIGLVGEGIRPFGKRFSDYRNDNEPATLYMNDKSKRKGSSWIETLTLRFTVLQDWHYERCIFPCRKQKKTDVEQVT